MMNNIFFTPVLRKTMFISLLGHITLFSIFTLSFGNRIPAAKNINVYFWGQFLNRSEIIHPKQTLNKKITAGISNIKSQGRFFYDKVDSSLLNKVSKHPPRISEYHLKPPLSFSLVTEKQIFIDKSIQTALHTIKRKEPVIVFHPLLPYGFMLYFKDRQIAHVELMFNIKADEGKNSFEIKRKISSGNLEVDLLSMRYIGHYLFMQQARFMPNKWQTVKIDLSAKND